MEELVKSESASGLTLMEVEKPKLGPRDVLFQVDRTGICGTDLHIYNWDSWTKKTILVPLVVGREFEGRDLYHSEFQKNKL